MGRGSKRTEAAPARERLEPWLLRVERELKADVEARAEQLGIPAAELARRLMRQGLAGDEAERVERMRARLAAILAEL